MSQHIALKKPCPLCQGVLERETGRTANPKPDITCSKCRTTWPDYAAMTEACDRQVKSTPITMTSIQARLGLVKNGVRTGRNLAGGVRAVGGLLGRIAANVKQFEGHDSAAQIGEALEGLVDQVILATEHIDEATKGKTSDLYEGKEEPEAVPPEGEEEAQED